MEKSQTVSKPPPLKYTEPYVDESFSGCFVLFLHCFNQERMPIIFTSVLGPILLWANCFYMNLFHFPTDIQELIGFQFLKTVTENSRFCSIPCFNSCHFAKNGSNCSVMIRFSKGPPTSLIPGNLAKNFEIMLFLKH